MYTMPRRVTGLVAVLTNGVSAGTIPSNNDGETMLNEFITEGGSSPVSSATDTSLTKRTTSALPTNVRLSDNKPDSTTEH